MTTSNYNEKNIINQSVMFSPPLMFKCLGDGTRLRCMVLLHKKGSLCVCEMTAALELSQPKISRHLALLRHHQLLLDSRDGQWVFYRINPNLPAWLMSLLDALLVDPSIQGNLNEDIDRLKHMGNACN